MSPLSLSVVAAPRALPPAVPLTPQNIMFIPPSQQSAALAQTQLSISQAGKAKNAWDLLMPVSAAVNERAQSEPANDFGQVSHTLERQAQLDRTTELGLFG